MGESVIYRDEFLCIFTGSDGIYIESFKKGLRMDQLSSILAQHPEIGVTSLSSLRNAIVMAPREPEKFAELKERLTVEITENDLSANIIFNLPTEALDIKNRESLIKEAVAAMNNRGVVHGIKKDLFSGELVPGKSYNVAEGVSPINGIDSIIKMYPLQESKPEVNDDGSVDFYELKLINRVVAGDWLGERIEATEGYPGQSVRGILIKPVKGRQIQLDYDKNTVQEVYNNHTTTLYARINGAVSYTNGRISVSNHLEIQGDVGLSTGNIKFDGYLTVKGSVCDGFSIEATRDIEINSELGLGSVKSIISSGGSIYIKGGISPKSRVEIKAAKNVFIKFVDNVNIISGGATHIGYYSLNSNITAKEVIFDASIGQIIGGSIKAEIKVIVPIIGSEIERKATVEVTGFDRTEMLQNLDSIFRKISDLKSEQQKLKIVVSNYDSKQANPFQRKEFNDFNDRLFSIREEIKALEDERKSIAGYLKTHGEGEIIVAKKIHPNSTLILNKNIMEISTILPASTFFIQDGAIKQI